MTHRKSTIAKFLTNSNAVAATAVLTICLLFPAAAFSQGLQFYAGRGQSANFERHAQNFSVRNLTDDGAGNWRRAILAANRSANWQASAGAAEIAAAGRGNPFVNFENAKPLAADAGNLRRRTLKPFLTVGLLTRTSIFL